MSTILELIPNGKKVLDQICFVRLKTGEMLISYSLILENSMVLFLPMEISKDGSSMIPFAPFVSDRAFAISQSEVQLLKSSVNSYIKNRYKEMTDTLYKDEKIFVMEMDESDLEDITYDAELESFDVTSQTIH